MAKWQVTMILNDTIPAEAAILTTVRNNSATLVVLESFRIDKVSP